jgi:hypothetical protein
MIAARGFEVGEVIRDMDVGGGTMDRPGLNKALGRVRDGSSGGIVVARVDRFARTLRGALDVLEELERAGGVFIECDGQGWDTSTSMGRFGRDLVSEGEVLEVVLLTPPDDPRTLTLERAIRHDGRGRGSAWTMSQRYTSEAALRRNPTTTDDL